MPPVFRSYIHSNPTSIWAVLLYMNKAGKSDYGKLMEAAAQDYVGWGHDDIEKSEGKGWLRCRKGVYSLTNLGKEEIVKRELVGEVEEEDWQWA